MTNIAKLDAALRAVCPIDGVSSSRVISFKDAATQQQREAAQAISDAWVFAEEHPPVVVSRRQIKQALTRANLRTQVEAAVVSGDQDLKDWWNESLTFEEDHPMVVAMALGLGVDEAALHDLFVLAASL